MEEVTNILPPNFLPSSLEMSEIVGEMIDSIEAANGARQSCLLNAPTYSRKSAKIKNGGYIGIDFGGTNLRCFYSMIEDGKEPVVVKGKKCTMERVFKDGMQLFDKIVEVLKELMDEIDVGKENYPIKIGFCFSFPIKQMSISSGLLIKWTKGWQIPDVVGKDVCEMLSDAIDRNGLKGKVIVAALVNDTVGTLIRCSSHDDKCRMGVIAGTGSNACFSDKIKNINASRINPKAKYTDEDIILNMEWGNFNSPKLRQILTDWDKKIDATSQNPDHQMFEKLISGNYLGWITRLIIRELIEKNKIFHSDKDKALKVFSEQATDVEHDKEGVWHSWHITFLDDLSNEREQVKIALDSFGLKSEVKERILVQTICDKVYQRAAYLTAVGIVSVLTHIGVVEEKNSIAFDGSLFENSERYRKYLEEGIKIISKGKCSVDLIHSKDGSGIGAVLVAAGV